MTEVTCPHCGATAVVSLDANKEVERTTPSRMAVGILPKPNVTAVTCPEGHRFYVEYVRRG